MSQEKRNIESIFRQAFSEHTEKPSPQVLRNLKFRLGVRDFFSFNFRKVNFVYTFGAVAVFLFLAGSRSVDIVLDDFEMDSPNTEMPSDNAEPGDNDNEETVAVVDDVMPEVVNEVSSESEELVEEKITAMFIPSVSSGCAPLEVEFNNKSVKASVFNWKFGNGIRSERNNPVYTYTKAGQYTVELEVRSAKGEKASYSQLISVHEKPEAAFEIDIQQSQIADKKILFKNKSTGATSYTWYFGDNQQADVANPEHIYGNYGVYKVHLVASNEAGCTDTFTIDNSFLAEDYELVFPGTFNPTANARSNNGYYKQGTNRGAIYYPLNNGAKSYNLKIKTRSGMTVFTSNDIEQGWNGVIRGRLAPSGTYYYEANGEYPNGKEFTLSGSFRVSSKDYTNDYSN